MNADEEKIWRSIQQKDEQAFEQYYKEHYKIFFLAASGYLKDASLAEEIVNDVFVRLWEAEGTIQIESSLKCLCYHKPLAGLRQYRTIDPTTGNVIAKQVPFIPVIPIITYTLKF